MQTVQIKKWGNSNAIRIPVNILETLKLTENDWLEISVDKETNQITLKADDGLTPYQRLIPKHAKTPERKVFVWDRVEEELPDYPPYMVD